MMKQNNKKAFPKLYRNQIFMKLVAFINTNQTWQMPISALWAMEI